MNHEPLAIIGVGAVGSSLGARARQTGFPVHFGVRDAAKATSPDGALPIAEAVAQSSIIFLAVPADAAVAAAKSAGALAGKIVVDCTNPLRWDGGPVWNPPREGSVTAALAAALPGVAVMKGFNHFGAETHANPEVSGGKVDVFIAGDDAAAKQRVLAVADGLGFRGRDAGPLRNAAVLENLAMLWIQQATTSLGRQFAFRIETR